MEIDGITLAAFRECAGLASETAVFEIREGGLNDRVHKLAGPTWHSPITLCRGLTMSMDLWDWRQQVIQGGEGSRRTGDVVLCDMAGGESMRWTFLDGWPSRWEGPLFHGELSALALEKVEIVHEGLVLHR